MGVPVDRDDALFLLRWFHSIDVDVRNLIIVTGGNETGLAREVEHIALNTQRLTHIYCDEPPACPEGWNWIISTFFDEAPWFLISAADVQWQPGALARLSSHVWRDTRLEKPEEQIDFAMINYINEGKHLPWNAWVITRRLLMRVGMFDENFVPAYWEDQEMEWRFTRVYPEPKKAVYKDVKALHGHRAQAHEHGMAGPTLWTKDPARKAVITRALIDNGFHVGEKWGCEARYDCEKCYWTIVLFHTCKFRSPFNITDGPVWAWYGSNVTVNQQRRYNIMHGIKPDHLPK